MLGQVMLGQVALGQVMLGQVPLGHNVPLPTVTFPPPRHSVPFHSISDLLISSRLSQQQPSIVPFIVPLVMLPTPVPTIMVKLVELPPPHPGGQIVPSTRPYPPHPWLSPASTLSRSLRSTSFHSPPPARSSRFEEARTADPSPTCHMGRRSGRTSIDVNGSTSRRHELNTTCSHGRPSKLAYRSTNLDRSSSSSGRTYPHRSSSHRSARYSASPPKQLLTGTDPPLSAATRSNHLRSSQLVKGGYPPPTIMEASSSGRTARFRRQFASYTNVSGRRTVAKVS
mmetsp:Transcript_29374/g.54498  ORF Transcript_29374/g.54498 Transcript_29374/m.54498 type:complete len:283 (-) Transcript_29374:782-1630(-)